MVRTTVPPSRVRLAPVSCPPPVTIGVYDIDEPGNPHQHIDFVYFTRPAEPGTALDLPENRRGMALGVRPTLLSPTGSHCARWAAR